MAGWAGEGGGRFGERREYEAPTLPSTPRQPGAARHHKSQAKNGKPPKEPAEKLTAAPTRHGGQLNPSRLQATVYATKAALLHELAHAMGPPLTCPPAH